MTQPPTVQSSGAAKGEPTWREVMVYPLGAVGAMVGAAVGAFAVYLGWRSGFYTIPLIGLLAGWGAALCAPKGGWAVGAIAGIVAAGVGAWAEWHFFHTFWKVDDSFAYLLMHFHRIGIYPLLLHVVGIAAAVWFGARK